MAKIIHDLKFNRLSNTSAIDPGHVDRIARSIARDGLQVKIVVDRATNAIIDGRHRKLALDKLGIPVTEDMVEWVEGNDAVLLDKVVMLNVERLARRPSQLAMLAAQLWRERTAAGLQPGTHAEMARRVGVSERLVAGASTVLAKAPDLFPHIVSGRVSIHKAEAAMAEADPARRAAMIEDLIADPKSPQKAKKRRAVVARLESMTGLAAELEAIGARLDTMPTADCAPLRERVRSAIAALEGEQLLEALHELDHKLSAAIRNAGATTAARAARESTDVEAVHAAQVAETV